MRKRKKKRVTVGGQIENEEKEVEGKDRKRGGKRKPKYGIVSIF